jgi:hypothetical protein
VSHATDGPLSSVYGRCAVMGREDSVASEATTVEDDTALSTPPPMGPSGAFEGPAACFKESQPSAAQHSGDTASPAGRRGSGESLGRSPLGPRAFGGSCELVYSTNGHRVAESQVCLCSLNVYLEGVPCTHSSQFALPQTAWAIEIRLTYTCMFLESMSFELTNEILFLLTKFDKIH